MTNLLKLPTWADKQHIYAVVETPRGSTCKLDFDPELRAFTLAKPLMAGLTYPYDWGFIPSTKAEDGDPLDVLVIHDAQTYPGVVLRCRPSRKRRARRRSETTASSRCRTALPWRRIWKTFAACRLAPATSWNSSFRLRTRSKKRR
jgi:Inorganic pyrophosphatase